MPRALAILKYIPAVLCGLLVVAWVVSCIFEVGPLARLPAGPHRLVLGVDHGSVDCSLVFAPLSKWSFVLFPSLFRRPLGLLRFFAEEDGYCLLLPIPMLLTLGTPLVVGPFNRFRFPLWSYFAWTALVAAELAYYLRA
jgi:hypothetical protein